MCVFQGTGGGGGGGSAGLLELGRGLGLVLFSISDTKLPRLSLDLYRLIDSALLLLLASVVQRVDNFICWIARYPADKMCARFS